MPATFSNLTRRLLGEPNAVSTAEAVGKRVVGIIEIGRKRITIINRPRLERATNE